MEESDRLDQARSLLRERLGRYQTNLELPIQVRPLDPDEAIGKDADPSFVIKKGKERIIEATFQGHKGQAFTDRPIGWSGNLADLLSLNLDEIPKRAVFVAGLNAVLSALEQLPGTVHCKDEDPSRCGSTSALVLSASALSDSSRRSSRPWFPSSARTLCGWWT